MELTSHKPNNKLGQGSPSRSLANKKTLIDTNEHAICHEYWSEDSLGQEPQLKLLNVKVRCNNNAPAQLNDCIEGLLHLGPEIITFGTLLHLGPNVITFRTLLNLGLQCSA